MTLKSASIRFAALLALTTSAGMLTLPLAMAQISPAATQVSQAGSPRQHTPPPMPATVVSQLGLSGSKASQVQQLLEQRQAAWTQFRQAAKANHDQLKQLLTPEQFRQLRQIEHQHGPHGHHGHHAHDGRQGPATAGSAG